MKGEEVSLAESVTFDDVGETKSTRMTSVGEIACPTLGKISFRTVLETSNRFGKVGVDSTRRVTVQRELLMDNGRRVPLPAYGLGPQQSSPQLDPEIRGRLIRSFYLMGFTEVAHRRTTRQSKEGSFEEHAWLHCMDLPQLPPATREGPAPNSSTRR